jgi:TonB family protein
MSQINDKLNKIKIDSIDNDIISSTAYISLRYAENYGYNIKSIDSIIYGQIRSKGSIMRTVMSNLKYLRYAYNWRLRQKPGLKGKISIKFAINSQGKIIYCKNIQSTMNDPLLEKDVEKIVSKWEFCPINSRIDVTEVVYPFVFSQ